jgi:hypothetical protein|tara:strand:- start:234 stop:575 length:342 start_codon:yes stop_codon:yes gene_type:complete
MGYRIEELEAKVNHKLKELGVDVKIETAIEPFNHKREAIDVFQTLGTIEINTSTLGLMSPLFIDAVIEIDAKVNVKQQYARILFHYRWEHPSGRNGYRLEHFFNNGFWVTYGL